MISVMSCASGDIKEKNKINLPPNEKKNAEAFLAYINDINNNSLSTISANLLVDGKFNRKEYKSMGKVLCDKKISKAYIQFLDFVFKSPITLMVQDKETIKFYYPATKLLYIDNYHTLNLYSYTGLNINFKFLYTLAFGQIPLLDDYSVKQVKDNFLILENKSFYETISFKGKEPDKILFINKTTKEKFEFYLWDITRKEKTVFYKRIKVISAPDMNINFHFSNIILNVPVNVKTEITLPKDVKIVNM